MSKGAGGGKMRVCLLSRFFDLRNAGIGRYSMELMRGLRERGLEVRTVSQDGGVPLGQGAEKYFVYTLFEIALKTPRDCDLYHACTPIETLWLGGKERKVVTFHDLIPMLYLGMVQTHYAKNKLTRPISKNYFTFACKRAVKCDAIIVNSDQTARELTEHFGVDREKIVVTRFGISPGLKPKNKNDGIYRIGTLGYLDPRKRIGLLIEAFREADLDTELMIAGKGVDMPYLKALAGGDERIKFLGFVPDEDLCDFYNSLDVFVFPSLLEGYGLPIVEAMACGKPVVTLADAIIPSDVKSRTYVCTPQELSTTLENKDFKCDLNSNLRFAAGHSWEKLVEKTIRVYKMVME